MGKVIFGGLGVREDVEIPSDEFEPTPIKNLPKLSDLGTTTTEDIRLEMAEMGKKNLYFLCKVILGYTKLNERVHLPMCKFSDQTRGTYLRRMKLMPRTHFKTTIWTISETIQDIVNNPNVRILIVADTGVNATRFMQEIQQHFQYNEVFRWIFSEVIPENFNKVRWSTTEMDVKRSIVTREPTVDAIGAFGGIESRHYDIIRPDDLVTEKAIRSDVEMDKLIQWVTGLESLLISQVEGRIDWVGSRKKKGDMYEVVQSHYGKGVETVEIGPYARLMGELAVFTRHAEENGEPIFPEMVTKRFLRRLRRTDPTRYHAQYANSPKGTGINTFDEIGKRFWKWDGGRVKCVHDSKLILDIHPSELEIIIFYDPSVAEKKRSSKQAINVVGKGSHPFRIVLESHVAHFPPDEAMDLLFSLQKKWSPSLISIEKRGFQGWVKYSLDDRAERDRVAYLPVVQWPPEGSPKASWAKTEHIRALQPLWRDGLIWLHEDQTELIDEFEFYPNVRWDDGLDSLAQGLDYWPYSEDEEVVAKKRSDEMSYLEMAALGVAPGTLDREKWSEDRFLSMFDATGYHFKGA